MLIHRTSKGQEVQIDTPAGVIRIVWLSGRRLGIVKPMQLKLHYEWTACVAKEKV